MDNKKKTNADHDRRKYKKIIVRVRRDSDLCREIERHNEVGGVSLNFLINSFLCEHFSVPLHHRHYITTERRKIIE